MSKRFKHKLALKDERTRELALDLYGRENLALELALEIARKAGRKLKPAEVAKLLEINPEAASKRITAIQERFELVKAERKKAQKSVNKKIVP